MAQTVTFNDDTIEWRRQSAVFKTWSKYKLFFHRVHREQKTSVTTSGKGGYNAIVQNIFDAPPPSPEEHYELIKDIQTIMQGVIPQVYEMEGLAQANAVLTRSNSAVMAQLTQVTVTMNAIQVQLKTLASAQNHQARPKKRSTAGFLGAISLTGAKPDRQRKRDINRRCITKKDGWQ